MKIKTTNKQNKVSTASGSVASSLQERAGMRSMRLLCGLWLLLLCGSLSAQVTIGVNEAPAKGALLDLKQETKSDATANAKKGLLLPRVKLSDRTKLKMGDEDELLGDEREKHKGLVVYNVTDELHKLLCHGIYIWQGDKWARMPEECTALFIQEDIVQILTGNSAKLTGIISPVKPLMWHSSDPSVATVSADGTITTIGEGFTNITIAATVNGEVKTSEACRVDVATLRASIDSNIKVLSGATYVPTLTYTPTWADNLTTTWSGGTAGIVTVNTTTGEITPASNIPTLEGEATTINVAISKGNANATASSSILAATLRSDMPTAKELVIWDLHTELKTMTLSATTPSWAGTTGTLTTNYGSSAPSVAAINNAGVINATQAGTTNISKNVKLVLTKGGQLEQNKSFPLKVSNANPYKILDTRAGVTEQYQVAYFGSIDNSGTMAEWGGNWWMTEELRALRDVNGNAFPSGTVYLNPGIMLGDPNTALEIPPSGIPAGNIRYGVSLTIGEVASPTVETYAQYVKKHGLLYSRTLKDRLCPTGWKIPTAASGKRLVEHLMTDDFAYTNARIYNGYYISGVGAGYFAGWNTDPWSMLPTTTPKSVHGWNAWPSGYIRDMESSSGAYINAPSHFGLQHSVYVYDSRESAALFYGVLVWYREYQTEYREFGQEDDKYSIRCIRQEGEVLQFTRDDYIIPLALPVVQTKVDIKPTLETSDMANVVWTSDKPEIASVDNNGMLTAHKDGAVRITATLSKGGKVYKMSTNFNIGAIEFFSYPSIIPVNQGTPVELDVIKAYPAWMENPTYTHSDISTYLNVTKLSSTKIKLEAIIGLTTSYTNFDIKGERKKYIYTIDDVLYNKDFFRLKLRIR